MAVRIVNTPAFNEMLRGSNGIVMRATLQRALRVETSAKRRVKVDHGRLRQSITHQVTSVGGEPSIRVGTNVIYAMWVHNGTGIYGPTHMPIKPKVKSILRFTKNGRTVFAKTVKGQPANPFLADAIREV